MAIKMVRQPSDTPNIRNIDDIVGLRYAYGNQNGYVIGKGNELSYTIEDTNFRVNSGRVVLQGVESDIDANGVVLSVDNVSELRYYTVYYQVNMATNKTAILLSNYDTAGYPSVDSGDDLTETTTGIANLELYHFQAQNGVISEVEKLVNAIEYINVNYVNNLFNTAETTKFGEYIIGKYEVLYSPISKLQTVDLIKPVQIGDCLLIECYYAGTPHYICGRAEHVGTNEQTFSSNYFGGISSASSFALSYVSLTLSLDGTTLSYTADGVVYEDGSFRKSSTKITGNGMDEFFYISKVYRIIE